MNPSTDTYTLNEMIGKDGGGMEDRSEEEEEEEEREMRDGKKGGE